MDLGLGFMLLHLSSVSCDQVGAREDCWPIENVSKVSVITGEFNGHSVSGLIHYCWAYFLVCMFFDLLQTFVVENIEVPHNSRSMSYR